MFYIADLHVHSHYSRATSKNLNLETLYQWARIKGIHVVGTGDFTHPQWFSEIKEKLEPDGNGLFRLKNPPKDPALPGLKVHDIDVRFCLSTEISSIYKYGDKVRKNHNLVYAPDLDTVAQINAKLSTIGNLKADGRPILGLPSRDLLEIVTETSERAYLVPAHVWTPWFSTLGSRGGYDSIDECFRDLSGRIFALETGLSSDPEMNWKWSALDRFTLISNSDAHSPQKLGREANLFDTEMSYDGLFDAIKTQNGFLGTYEFFPEEGKYHLDGHRNCGITLEPGDTTRYNGICPVCGKPLTVGVLNRVESLADRKEALKPARAAEFEYLIPLPEIIAEIKGVGPSSKTVTQAYQQTISTFGNEFSLLEKVPVEDIKRSDPVLAEAIRRMRAREVHPQAGYDGVYGTIRIFDEAELARMTGQLHLFGLPETVKPAKEKRNTPLPQEETAKVAAEPAVPLKQGGLNKAQQQVKESASGAVLVKAGPGTGKTSTLIHWIANQIKSGEALPAQVLAITFTNKAAREIGERLKATLEQKAEEVTAGTFHSVAYRMLRSHRPEITAVYDETNRLSVIHLLFPKLSERECKQLATALSNLFERNADDGFDSLSEYALAYREYVQRQGAVDLSDILNQLLSLWKEKPETLESDRAAYKAIAVDEFQDINPLQYDFITRLAQEKNLLAIGDPDQAIYGFRGSDVSLFFRFAKDFQPKEISLTKNYRSVPVVLKAAGELIARNRLRSNLTLDATRQGKQPIKLFEAENPAKEADFIAEEIEKKLGGFNLLSGGIAYHEGDYAFSDIAVLYRTHQVGRELLKHFRQANIPVVPGDGSNFLSGAPFNRIVYVLQLLINPADRIALESILNYLPGWDTKEVRSFLSQLNEAEVDWTEITPKTNTLLSQESFKEWISFYRTLSVQLPDKAIKDTVKSICEQFLPDSELSEEQIPKKELIIALAEDAGSNVQQFLNDVTLSPYTDAGRYTAQGIRLLTFHAAKGLEFPVVFIAGAEEGITPSGRKDTDMEEERRLFYVAMTRARDELYITHSATRFLFSKQETHKRSRFVAEFSPTYIEALGAEKNKPKKILPDEEQMKLF